MCFDTIWNLQQEDKHFQIESPLRHIEGKDRQGAPIEENGSFLASRLVDDMAAIGKTALTVRHKHTCALEDAI